MTLAKIPSFPKLLQDQTGQKFIQHQLDYYLHQQNKKEFFKPWYEETGESGEVYPTQGLLATPFDYLKGIGKTLLSEEELWETLATRYYVLSIFNHPDRVAALEKIDAQTFQAPQPVATPVLESAQQLGLSLAVEDLGLHVCGADHHRVSRRKILAQGPFLKLGQQARIPFSGGAMPDIYGSPAALATMAMSHALVSVPRNGVFSSIQRQVDLVKAAFAWLEHDPLLVLNPWTKKLIPRWKRNIVGVVEPDLKGGWERLEALYEAGVRTFRIYSPEPSREIIEMTKQVRKKLGDKVEIFTGQVVDVAQAQAVEAAGADGIFVGVGGGGRCITAVRSSSVVDWPELVWELRGKISLPIVVEGGASSNIGVALALGASAIGVTRIAGGGTIESPGGLLYWVTKDGQWFKPYGGEASARTKYQDKKMYAYNIPAFVEGETTMAVKSYFPHLKPTLAQNLLALTEDMVLSLVFRGTKSITEFQAINPSPLRRVTSAGIFQQHTH